MEKMGKVRLFSAVTLFVSFLCIAVTFVIQIRMQKTVTELSDTANTTAPAVSLETQTENAMQGYTTSPLADQSETAPLTPAAAQVGKEESSATRSQNRVSGKTDATTKSQQTTQKRTTTTKPETTTERSTEISPVLVVNVNTKKIHSPHCSYLQNTDPANTTQITADELQSYLESGYTLCKRCGGYAG